MNEKKPANCFKIVLAVVLAILMMAIAQVAAVLPYIILDLAGVTMNETAAKIMAALLYPIITCLLIAFLTGKLLKCDMAAVGLTKINIPLPDILLAVLLPAIVAACYCLFVPGHFQTSSLNLSIAARLFAAMLSTGAAVAFVEELVFRGVIAGILETCSNRITAAAVSSLLFAALHLISMDGSAADSVLAILGIGSIGVLLSLLRFKTGGIWSGFLVHCIWNTFFTVLLPISATAENSIVPLRYVLDTDHRLLTGGSYGIEGSFFVIVIFAFFSFVLSRGATGDRSRR